MRPLLALPLLASLSASGALALEIDAGSHFNGAPVTTGAIMQAAKVSAFRSETEFSFANAQILSDAQIAELIPASAKGVAPADSPAIMAAAKETVQK
jgi:hypothetical protein